MGSFWEDEECSFYDAHEDIASISGSGCFDNNERIDYSHYGFCNDVWIRSPRSVKERRSEFFHWMEEGLDEGVNADRISENSGAVLRTPCLQEEFSSSRSSVSCWSNDDADLLGENFVCRVGNVDGRVVCDVDEMGLDDQNQSDVGEMGLENNSGSLRVMDENVNVDNSSVGATKRVRKGWLSRLRSLACVLNNQGKAEQLRPDEHDGSLWPRIQRMKVHQNKKRAKELSALFMGQEIQAHEGSILTMKFSPDGQYLASAGKDGIVRVWQVVEDRRLNEHDIPEMDPSCIYFTVNHLSELKPLFMDKEKLSILRSLRKTSDSACVIFPPKVFRILEKPLHEFHGHSSEILDLSWSKTNYLLSASVDKTVCLWRVGNDHCLRVFSHSNYVTCVHFNPVDDNYFISGSIDGKVRIWAIRHCQVVDWANVRDIITAVCYHPEGQGGIIGCMTGSCRFYNISDNNLQLDAEICLNSKKKALCKRITGFEFLPEDSSKVMVTCADSQVRILQGPNVIGKFRGRSTGNQLSACFTSDGKHIISTCEDSSVYIWNCAIQEEPALHQAKTIKSWERFTTDASVAIPWCGLKCENSGNEQQCDLSGDDSPDILSFAPASFSLGEEYFLESFPKGSATWPEEKLPTFRQLPSSSAMHKSQHKFLKTSCQCTTSSHAWGLVIVTAGRDGRIRSFHNYGLPTPL